MFNLRPDVLVDVNEAEEYPLARAWASPPCEAHADEVEPLDEVKVVLVLYGL